MGMDAVKYNRMAWDKEVSTGENEWTKPVGSEVIERARNGDFEVILTPNKPVPRSWFPIKMAGIEILGLASGGGQQVPVLAATGAKVTSFDNSPKQLEQDEFVAKRDGLEIQLELGDAADLSRFEDKSFDLIFHPVSNCFFPEIQPVWNEAFRVLREGGVLLAGYHNSILFIFDSAKDNNDRELVVRHKLPYSDIESLEKEELDQYISNCEPIEYSHTLDAQIGGQIKAGFIIDGFFEDDWSDEATTLNKYCNTFIATRARKN